MCIEEVNKYENDQFIILITTLEQKSKEIMNFFKQKKIMLNTFDKSI